MKEKVKKLLINLTLLLAALISLYPFILMVFASFKTPVEFSRNPAFIPLEPTLQNYYDLFIYNGGSIGRSYLNSIFITFVYTSLSLVICAMAAYGFSKFHFKGRNLIFILLLSTMTLPSEILISPMYLMMSKLKLIDTYSVQIFPGIANLFGMYMLRQNMLGIHDSILDSARIDGAGEWTIFRKIVIPISAPAIGAFCILVGLGKWNEFTWPAFMVNSIEKSPIMLVLPMLSTSSQSRFATPWTLILSGCVIATLPIFILFLVFHEKIMSSVTMGAVKE